MRGRRRRRGPFLEVGKDSLKVLSEGRGIEIPLERTETGELTSEARENTASALREFLGIGPRAVLRAACAVPARGVSLRRFSVPAAPSEELERVLALQLESDFPLSPDKLAWSYHVATPSNGTAPGPDGRMVTVVALRRDSLDEHAALLVPCGIDPVFRLAAIAGARLSPRVPGRSAFLDIGRANSELLLIEDGEPSSVRSIPWGGETVTARLGAALGVDRKTAEALKLEQGEPRPPELADGDSRAAAVLLEDKARGVIDEALRDLARLLAHAWASGFPGTLSSAADGNGSKPCPLFLTGGGARLAGLVEALERAFQGTIACRHIEIESSPGCSAATLGLEEEETARGPASRSPELSLACRAKAPARGKTGRAPRVALWAAVAAFLAAAAITVPHVSLFWRLPDLERRLEETRGLRASLPQLDNELAFFENLDASQVHYLDALAALAGAAPQGTILESLTMNRQGEVSFQGTALGTQAPNVLRGKLAMSGWFSHVVLEEQSPKDDKHVTFRLRARMRTSTLPGGSQ